MAEGTIRDLPENGDMSDCGNSQFTPLKAVILNQYYDENDATNQNIIWGENNTEDWNNHDEPWYNSSPAVNTTNVDQPPGYSYNPVMQKEDSRVEKFCDSQPVCNQELFTILDEELKNQPRQVYIDKLLSRTDNCDDTIFFYRAILAKRARLLSNCPKGQLMTRKCTKAGTVAQKYATDCYCLQNFILNNDPKAVADTFCRKAGNTRPDDASVTDQSQTPIRQPWIRNELAELKAEISMLKQDVHTLKVQKQRDDLIIKRLETELADHRRKAEATITNFKTEIQCIRSEVMKKEVTGCERRTSDSIETVSKKPYADVVSGRTNTSPAPSPSNDQPSAPGQSDVVHTDEEHDNTNRVVFSEVKRRIEHRSPNKMQKQKTIEVRITHKRENEIPVKYTNYSQSNTLKHVNENNTDNEPVLESVQPKRTRRYYVGGIASSSNRAGFVQFLSELGIRPVGLRLISTRNNDLAAKLTVDTRDSYIIENKKTWPRGVHCRRWYSENEWSSWVNSKQTYHDNP